MTPNEFQMISNEFKMNFEAFRNHIFQKIQQSKMFDSEPENTLRRQKIHQSGTRLKRRVKFKKKKKFLLILKKGARHRVCPKCNFRSAKELELELTIESERELEPEL